MENSVNRNKQIIIKICFCLVLFYVGVMICDIGDYPAHRSHIETQSLWNILGGGSGYPLYFAFMRIVYVALNCPIIYAQGIVTGGCLVLSYLLCIYFLKQQLLQYNVKEIVIYTFTWILFICGQIWVPWSSKSIIHYTSPNIWHNGTNIVGRCFGILAFFYLIKCLKIITDSDFTCLPTVRNFKEATFICVISVMAKPSFAQSFAPAFGVYLFFYLLFQEENLLKD